MPKNLLFRPARPDEAEALGEMIIAGASYWGHDKNFPDLIESLRQTDMPTPEYIEAETVFIAEENGGVVGFYGLQDHEDFIDMRYLFLDTDYIGKGYGKALWLHSLEEAKKTAFERMRILSDPGAVGFYSAMGAVKERDHAVTPEFILGVFWFDLTSG